MAKPNQRTIAPAPQPPSVNRADDEDLRIAVSEEIATFDPIRSVSLWRMNVTVSDGVVTLWGNIATTDHKKIAAELAARVPRAVAVDNELISDEELQLLLAAAFERQEETRARHGPVEVFLGTVTLNGPAPTPGYQAAAPALALAVPGVRLVIDRIGTGPAFEAPQEFIEARFGLAAICEGDEVGRVEQLRIDTGQWHVRAVILGDGPSSRRVAAPAIACARSDERYLYLDLTKQQFARLPTSADWTPAAAGELLLDSAFEVESLAGARLAGVGGARLHRAFETATHLGVRLGRLEAISGWLPVGECRLNGDNVVVTRLSADELQQLVERGIPRTDGEILDELYRALRFTTWEALPAGVVRARSTFGRLELDGDLRSPMDRAALERIAGSISGVVAVESRVTLRASRLPF